MIILRQIEDNKRTVTDCKELHRIELDQINYIAYKREPRYVVNEEAEITKY